MAVCRANPDEIEYWEPTGYRLIPLTTCQNGLNLDHHVSKPCPSKEKEYGEKHGISGIALFFAIVIPLGLAAGAGYYAYTRWDGKFGQIRLGEGAGGSDGFLSRSSPLVTVPIAAIAGIVAVAKRCRCWLRVSGVPQAGTSGLDVVVLLVDHMRRAGHSRRGAAIMHTLSTMRMNSLEPMKGRAMRRMRFSYLAN